MTITNVLIFLLGVCCGILINEFIHQRQTSSGTLKIDHSNPDKDTYRFEIDNLEDLDNKKEILLTIDHNADLSQQ